MVAASQTSTRGDRLLGLMLVAACAFGSGRQVRFWVGTRALFEHSDAVTRRNYIAAAVLGTVHAQAGRHDQARQCFLRSLEYRPDFFDGHAAFGNALLQARNFTEAAAHFERALGYNPRHFEAWNGLGAALVQQGRAQEGLDQFDRALQIKPDFIDAQRNRALTLQSLGRIPEAIVSYREVLRLKPNSLPVLLSLGNLLLSQRRIGEAVPYFQQVLRLNPDNLDALNRVAWILSTHPEARLRNGSEALRLAKRANILKGGQDAPTLNTLAAAYAEMGQFPAAVATAQQALQLATASGPPELAAIIQKLLDLYKSSTPYRDE